MSHLQNDCFIRALRRQTTPYTPIWIMRQAGRYLPEYRETRKSAGDFMQLCKNPNLVCDVTLQPIDRFPLDAAIIFSDILTIPDAMGLGLHFEKDHGPRFEKPIETIQQIDRLPLLDPCDELNYVMHGIQQTKKSLRNRVPLIGFSGSPWTLATYMVEGGSSKQFSKIKKLLFTDPDAADCLLTVLEKNVSAYLCAQIDAGADALMIFDTWGGVLSTRDFEKFSLNYMKNIVRNLKRYSPTTPVILFTKQGGQWLELMMETGCDALGIDWTTDLKKAKERVAGRVSLQGNMDPAMLQATPKRIQQEVSEILSAYGAQPGHVFNLGHGITPDIDPENVAVLVDEVHSQSAALRTNSQHEGA